LSERRERARESKEGISRRGAEAQTQKRMRGRGSGKAKLDGHGSFHVIF
jgi:hypothetical protein